jgi:ribosomal-protein-alanine N-acetyltransferase
MFSGSGSKERSRYATGVEMQTPRLLLRGWLESDRTPFTAMNTDPVVMRHYPATMTAAETDAMLARNQLHFERHGFGLWAVVERETGEFTGYIGLAVPSFEARFTPCVEIGWRLAPKFWNRGMATEGATAVLGFAFESLGLDEVVSFTAVENLASRRVMEKLGMIHNPDDDFDHPKLPEGHRLQRHVLYRAKPIRVSVAPGS